MRYRISIRILSAFVLFTLPEVASSSTDTLQVRVGFQKLIERSGVTRISIGNPELLEARPLPGGNEVIAVGKKEGETDLVVWDKGGKSSWKVVIVPNGTDAFEDASDLVRHFPGIRVERSGKSLLLLGKASSPEDRDRIENFARSRPGIMTRISIPEEGKRLLSYNLQIVEISKGASSQVGFRYPDALTASGAWTGGYASALSVGSQFDARLNLLLADGKARILANPRLVCESGSTADFLAGGEIPIVMIAPESRTVLWKTYGIILKVSPVIQADNTITTRITVEISTIDHGSGSSEVPGFLTRRVSTSFSSRPGNTVMISGLVKSESAKDVARVPVLGQLPVLGELFKSRSFRENQSELAIFITPSEPEANSIDKLKDIESKSSQMAESMRFRLID